MKKTILFLFLVLTSFVFVACETTTTSTTLDSTSTVTTSETDTTTTSTSGTTSTSTTPTTLTTLPSTVTTTTTETTNTTPVQITLKDTKNYLMTDVDVDVDLTAFVYKGEFGEVPLNEGEFINLPSEITVTGSTLTVSEKGMYSIDFQVGEVVVAILVFAKLAEETEYVVFEASYDELADGSLPEGYTLQTGTASIKDGDLYLDGIATTPTRVLLPSYLNGFKNYIIETDFTILSVKEPTRWASVMYRYGTSGYFQMAIRQNATATNGVEFAKWINNNWNVPKTTSHTEMINSESNYRLRIDLKGDLVKEYINGTLMIEYENASDFTSGSIGFQASGSIAVYDNIRITIPADYLDMSSLEFTMIPTLYEPSTGIQLPPSVLKFATTMDDITAMQEEVRPQVLVMTVDQTMNVVSPSGAKITTILEALIAIDGRVIPAFYIRNRDVAVAVATVLKGYGIRDVFLISRNVAAITDARATYSMLRGILEIDYDSGTPILGDIDRLAIRDAVNSCGALGALLPEQYITKENVEYLQKRLLSVFTNASKNGNEAMFASVLAGADGIIASDIPALYAFYAEFPENSLIRTPLIIAHRGIPSQAPENTVEGSLLAFELGANVIELDIYLTTDNRLVVIHDSTTQRTANGNLTVESSSLAELKALTILDATGNFPGLKIPTLDEYFDAFGGEDVQIFIEIKSSKPEIVPVLATLIATYGIGDQVSVIAFATSQVDNMRLNLPTISVGYLNSSLANASNLEGSLLLIMNSVVPIKTTFNPSYSTLSEELIRQLHYRGINTYPWTIDTTEDIYRYYGMGVGGITTNFTGQMTNEWVSFVMNETVFHVDLANPPASILLRGIIGTQGGLSYPYIPQFVVIDDGGTGITISANATVTGFAHTGTALVRVSFQSTYANGTAYCIYDELVTITVTDSRVSTTDGLGLVVSLLALVPPTIQLANKGRKHRSKINTTIKE